jgi:hypothetical protein
MLLVLAGIVSGLLVLLLVSEAIRYIIAQNPRPPDGPARGAPRTPGATRMADYYRMAAIAAARYAVVPSGRILRRASRPNQIRIEPIRDWTPGYELRPVPPHRRGGQVVDGCIFDRTRQRIVRYVKLANYHY